MLHLVGVFGALCFAFCLLPQVVQTYKEKDASGLSWAFLLLSLGGNVASCGYVVYTNFVSGVWQYPLYFNYAVAFVLCILLMVAKKRFNLRNLKEVKISENADPKLSEKSFEPGKISVLNETADILKKDVLCLIDEKRNLKSRIDNLLEEREVLFFEIEELKKYIQSKGFDPEIAIDFGKYKKR